jgi:hypothetical protein
MMIKNKKIKIFLLIILAVLGIKVIKDIKYKMDMKNAKELVMKELVERYDEKFEIRRTTYDKRKEKWMVEVYPLENNIKDETFVAQVTKYDDVIENYYSIKNANLTTIYYQPIIKKIFKEEKLYFRIGFRTQEANINIKKIKDVNSIFNKYSDKTMVVAKLSIYEDVTSKEEKKEEFLKEVWELFKYLKSQNLKWASIRIKIFDSEFFKDKVIDKSSEYRYYRKQKYSIWIEEKEYYEIDSFDDIKKQLNYMEKLYQKD